MKLTPEIFRKKLNTLLNIHLRANNNPSKISANGTTPMGEVVAVAFNDYFTLVANSHHDPNCLNFMGPPIQETEFLFPITADEVVSTIISQNNTTRSDANALHIRPVKYFATTIAPVLEHIIIQIFFIIIQIVSSPTSGCQSCHNFQRWR